MPSARAAFFMAKPGDRVVVDGEKLKVDGNGLRTPTKKERLKGLPKSVKEAKKRGLNVYKIPGQPAKIMRYKTRRKEDSLGLKAEHENFDLRKDNRFGSGGSGKGKRGDAEKTASPDSKVRSKANQKMARISSKGRVGHHGLPVAYYAAGKREAIAKGGPEAGKLFDQRYGLKGGAHSVANIYDMSHPAHDKLHNVKEPAYFKSIKEAGKETDAVLGRNNKMKAGKANRKNYNGNGNGNGNGLNGKNGKNGKLNGGVLGAASKTRKVDALANIGANAATGNYAAVGVGGGALIMTQALQNKKTQQALGKQIGQLVGKRAGRSMMKAVPGLDVFLSGQETVDYLKQGKLDQAGIAALSGAIGWIPIIGDGISASLDLSNTGIDIARLQVPTGTSKKKCVKGTTRRTKLKV